MDCREKIISEDYVDFILDFPFEEVLGENAERFDYCYQAVDQRIGILSIHRDQLSDITLRTNDYMVFPDLLGLQQDGTEIETASSGNAAGSIGSFDPSPLIQSGITRVQGETLHLIGRNVIVAFADTGINYRNRIFQNEDGTTRILALWDQTQQEGEPPEGFLFGTEYTREDINRALEAERELEAGESRAQALTVDENGHGTRMAATAAGSRLEGGSVYNSPAYAADLLVVKLRPAKQYLREYYQIPFDAAAYASTDVMLAIKYMDTYARAFVRPIVYCLGLGTNFRDHEGNGILSRYLASIASQRSRIMVIGGGNEGNAAHHYRGSFSPEEGFIEEFMEVFVSEGVEGFLMEIWTDAPESLTVSIQTPGGEAIPPTSVLFQTNLRYRFVFEPTVITVYNAYVSQGTGDALVLLRFENPSSGVWSIGVSDTGAGLGTRFDSWLPQTAFLQQPVYFLRPDPETTLTTPSYITDAITVAAYNSEDNSIYPDSGRGYSRDGRIKPDLAAPGVGITAVGNRLGEVPVISAYTGSSMAAAMMTGAAAQFAQWAIVDQNAPYVRSLEVKNYLIRGARRERNIEYPNPVWGWGRLDLYNTFAELEVR